jgi:hypothetical protein
MAQLTWSEVIGKYALRSANPQAGGGAVWSSRPIRNSRFTGRTYPRGAVFADDRVLYSYGTHFPLAVYLGDKGMVPVFLKNGDSYSVSTTAHQQEVQRSCRGPTVSFTALRAAGLDPEQVEAPWGSKNPAVPRLLDYREDAVVPGVERRGDAWFQHGNPWTPPAQGMFVPPPAGARTTRGFWHTLGATLFRRGEKRPRHFLASLDEGRYFVSELPRRPRGVDDAFLALQPKPVREALARGVTVSRQGEWFFVPTGWTDRELAATLGITQKELVRRSQRDAPLPDAPRVRWNQHRVARILVLDPPLAVPGGNVTVLARGRVRHVDPSGRATREHKLVDLGAVWHYVHRNTEAASWSQGGWFD